MGKRASLGMKKCSVFARFRWYRKSTLFTKNPEKFFVGVLCGAGKRPEYQRFRGGESNDSPPRIAVCTIYNCENLIKRRFYIIERQSAVSRT